MSLVNNREAMMRSGSDGRGSMSNKTGGLDGPVVVEKPKLEVKAIKPKDNRFPWEAHITPRERLLGIKAARHETTADERRKQEVHLLKLDETKLASKQSGEVLAMVDAFWEVADTKPGEDNGDEVMGRGEFGRVFMLMSKVVRREFKQVTAASAAEVEWELEMQYQNDKLLRTLNRLGLRAKGGLVGLPVGLSRDGFRRFVLKTADGFVEDPIVPEYVAFLRTLLARITNEERGGQRVWKKLNSAELALHFKDIGHKHYYTVTDLEMAEVKLEPHEEQSFYAADEDYDRELEREVKAALEEIDAGKEDEDQDKVQMPKEAPVSEPRVTMEKKLNAYFVQAAGRGGAVRQQATPSGLDGILNDDQIPDDHAGAWFKFKSLENDPTLKPARQALAQALAQAPKKQAQHEGRVRFGETASENIVIDTSKPNWKHRKLSVHGLEPVSRIKRPIDSQSSDLEQLMEEMRQGLMTPPTNARGPHRRLDSRGGSGQRRKDSHVGADALGLPRAKSTISSSTSTGLQRLSPPSPSPREGGKSLIDRRRLGSSSNNKKNSQHNSRRGSRRMSHSYSMPQLQKSKVQFYSFGRGGAPQPKDVLRVQRYANADVSKIKQRVHCLRGMRREFLELGKSASLEQLYMLPAITARTEAVHQARWNNEERERRGVYKPFSQPKNLWDSPLYCVSEKEKEAQRKKAALEEHQAIKEAQNKKSQKQTAKKAAKQQKKKKK